MRSFNTGVSRFNAGGRVSTPEVRGFNARGISTPEVFNAGGISTPELIGKYNEANISTPELSFNAGEFQRLSPALKVLWGIFTGARALDGFFLGSGALAVLFSGLRP